MRDYRHIDFRYKRGRKLKRAQDSPDSRISLFIIPGVEYKAYSPDRGTGDSGALWEIEKGTKIMSLNIRHLTNGEITIYTVSNTGVTPPTFEIYYNRESIDKNIRHYAKTDEPTHCEPDLARIFGVLDLFYPNHPNCGMPEYANKKCIAESCRYNNYSDDAERGKCPRIGTALEYHPRKGGEKE